MKRTMFLAFVLVLASAVSCFAIGAGVGVRSMGMGGTGIATANDITAAYFNPAGLMYGPENFESQTFAGGATQGLTGLAEALSSGTDFITNHFSDSYDIGASVSGGFGVSVKKVGLSVIIPSGYVNFQKPANALTFSLLGSMNAITPLTLGSTFATPGLPIASLSVGVNLKAIASGIIYTSVTQSGLTGTGNMYSSIGSGFGFDIGAETKVSPFLSVGAVVRNLSASTSIATTTKTITVDALGNVTEGPETKSTSSYIPPPEAGIGVGVVVPITGTLIAVDLENYSFPKDGYNTNKSETYNDTHIGIEQGFLMNIVMLRLGYFTYGPDEDTYYTCGLGLNLGPASLGVAAANSTKNSDNSATSAQFGIAF
jgi:hypothetical protein